MKILKIKVTTFEEILGTASSNPEIHEEFIASKAPDAPSREEEVAAIGAEEVFDKSLTVFPKDENGKPFAWDYQWKGFFKDACGSLRKVEKSECGKIKAYKKYKDPYILVLGNKEAETGTVSVTVRGCKEQLHGVPVPQRTV